MDKLIGLGMDIPYPYPTHGHPESGVGAIIRNDEGKVVAALCKALPSCYPAEWTELFALEQGIFLGSAVGDLECYI